MVMTVAVYSLLVGSLMLAWWGISLAGGALERTDRSRAEMALHLLAEFLTAAWLLAGGVALIIMGTGAAGFAGVGLGMLLYTVIVSPGYFLARREYPPVYVFGGLAALTVVAIVLLLLAE
jgi:hypothetical protein